jgi:uncharacterized protein Usg
MLGRRNVPILKPYCLATAEGVYRLPDHPSLLQSFIWQTMDIAPDFPSVRKFLTYWESHIEASIHSVKVASRSLIRPAEFRRVDQVWTVH